LWKWPRDKPFACLVVRFRALRLSFVSDDSQILTPYNPAPEALVVCYFILRPRMQRTDAHCRWLYPENMIHRKQKK